MLKTELIREYAKRNKITIDKSSELLHSLQKTILDTLETGEEVVLMDLGVFKKKEAAARKGRNPKTNEEIHIPAKDKIVFEKRKPLKDLYK